MRRLVYYTETGCKTPRYEDAKIVGITRVALEEIPEKVSIPPKRKEALQNLKMGLTFC